MGLYHTEQPDLVIMDVIMPEIDGYEAARALRANNTGWVPIIFLSGRAALRILLPVSKQEQMII
ncbi:MAG TPA: response regulator [Gammaproteobacteria bacterium]